ncbi:MAG: DUF1552 domain-containing protein [Polyangiaceae bacterium]|nr:DUF1552 domain-containing protein [Polyangiaceae bacterium]
MKFDRQHRRFFLQGLGGAMLALPFLPSLMGDEKKAHAQNAAKKRFITIKSYSAQNIRDWYPSRAVQGYTLRDYGADEVGGGNGKRDGTLALSQKLRESSGKHSDNKEYFGTYAPLTDFANPGISKILGPALNPFLSKLLLLRGLDFMPMTNHNDGGILGNYKGGSIDGGAAAMEEFPTIDQVLAYNSGFYPQTPSGGRSLHLSPGRANTFSYTHQGNLTGPVTQVTADIDPKVVFDRLFANLVPPGGTPPPVDPNKYLVDRVVADYASLKQNPRLSMADQQTVERHIGFLAELQARLNATPSTVACTRPNAPASSTLQGTDPAEITRVFESMTDLIAAAVQCDLTRIFTLDVYKAVGQVNGADQGFEHSCASCQGNPNPTDWHRAAHDWDQIPQRDKVVSLNEWMTRKIFVRLLEKLDVPEADGKTYLDNSLVLWGNELGMNHLSYSVPTLMAGSLGGHFETGRYIDYIDWDRSDKFSQHNGMVIEGVPYNRLFISILQAFGLAPSDYERQPGVGYGETRTLGKPADAFAVDYDPSQIARPLPALRV